MDKRSSSSSNQNSATIKNGTKAIQKERKDTKVILFPQCAPKLKEWLNSKIDTTMNP